MSIKDHFEFYKCHELMKSMIYIYMFHLIFTSLLLCAFYSILILNAQSGFLQKEQRQLTNRIEMQE